MELLNAEDVIVVAVRNVFYRITTRSVNKTAMNRNEPFPSASSSTHTVIRPPLLYGFINVADGGAAIYLSIYEVTIWPRILILN